MSEQKFYVLRRQFTLDQFENYLYKLLAKDSGIDPKGVINIISRREEYIDASCYYIKDNYSDTIHYDKSYDYTKEYNTVVTGKNDLDSNNSYQFIKYNRLDTSTYKGLDIKDLGREYLNIDLNLCDEFILDVDDNKLIEKNNELLKEADDYIKETRSILYKNGGVSNHYHGRVKDERLFLRIPIYTIEYEAYGKSYNLSVIPSANSKCITTTGSVNLRTKKSNGKNYLIKMPQLIIGIAFLGLVIAYMIAKRESLTKDGVVILMSIVMLGAALAIIKGSILHHKGRVLDNNWREIVKNSK